MPGPEPILEHDLRSLFGGGAQQVLIGTIGWEDQETYFEQGSASNKGYTLVRVQTFRGRNTSKKLKKGVGQGHKLLCHISAGIYRIPPKGTRCYVAMPSGYEDVPGAGVIIATVEKSPSLQFNDDRIQMNFGDDKHVVIRAKSVTIMDPGGRFICVGTPRTGGDPGLVFQDDTGAGGCIQNGNVGWWAVNGGHTKGLIQLSWEHGIDIVYKDSNQSAVSWRSGSLTATCDNTMQLAGGNTLVGPPGNPSPTAPLTPFYTAVAMGPAGAGVSTSIFISTP